MCVVGTMALETKVRGRSMIRPSEAAVSGLLEFRPMQADTHDTA
jgi:hypothetical protein